MAITYTPTTNFGAKDSLPTNDPDKVIKGSEFTTEFSAIQTAFSLAAPAASPTFTGDVTLSNGDILFGDDNKAIFGDGSDLQIYHDGSNSYINDNGTGSLNIQTGASTKLEITSTGIDVTGTVTADGLTVDGNTAIAGSQPRLAFEESDTTDLDVYLRLNGGDFTVETRTDAGVKVGDRIRAASNGDISFYEDTGTTAKLFWDASAESLGINDTSPARRLSVNSGTTQIAASFTSTSTTAARIGLVDGNTTGDNYVNVAAVGDAMALYAGAAERFRITSSGNVGIGTTSPSSVLHLSTSNDPQITLTDTGFGASADITGSNGNLRLNSQTATIFDMADSEVARIDSNGRLGIGTTSPAKPLHISQGANATATAIRIENTDTTITAAQDVNTIEFYTNDASASGTGVSAKIAQVAENNGNQYSLAFSSYNASLSEAMRIDDRPNLLVGTTSAAFDATNRATFEINGASNSLIALSDESSGSKAFKYYLYNDSGNSYITNFAADGYSHLWWTQGSERMRLDTNGDLKLGTTSITTNDGIQFYGSGQIYLHVAGTNATDTIRFYRNNTQVGDIRTSGTATSYNSGSDARLKENIADAEDAGATVDAIQVRQFDWIADGSHQRYGMVAQELLEVAPEAVSEGETEEDMMGVDYSKLVPMLIKEIQSLRARVAQLEGA